MGEPHTFGQKGPKPVLRKNRLFFYKNQIIQKICKLDDEGSDVCEE